MATETQTASPADETSASSRLLEVIRLFLKLGFTAFGGPAAHISMMHGEVVKKRRWISEQHFLDLLGATNLIPGPNSTEMAIHVGFVRAGWPGLILGGLSFLMPAVVIVLGMAWLYVQYGSTPAAEWLLYGIKPVIIGIVLDAILSLGRKAVKDAWTGAAGIISLVLYFLGVNELVLLFGAGLVVMLVKNARQTHLPLGMVTIPWVVWIQSVAPVTPFHLGGMFLAFLKIGSL
jgi:chromate transporter